jgi:hypothetical protein
LHTEPITEPIVLLTLVQQNLQGPDANRQESNAHVANLTPAALSRFKILNHLSQQKPRNYTDRKLAAARTRTTAGPPSASWRIAMSFRQLT